MAKSNLRRIDEARVSVEVLAAHQIVAVHVRKRMTPTEARDLAMDLLYAADGAEDVDSDMTMFGYEATDSRDLAALRAAIDNDLGWEDDEQEIDADYLIRVQQVGKILRQRLVLVRE
jgi:hypothetical protein